MLASPVQVGLDPYIFFDPHDGRTVFKVTHTRRGTWAGAAPDISLPVARSAWRRAACPNQFDLTYIMPRELQLLLERNGLKIDSIWGNYDGSPLRYDSPRMIVQAARSRRP